MLKSNSREVYGRHLNRSYFECGATNGVEIAKIFDVGLQAAAVRQRGNAVINEDIGVRPGHVVFDTPTSKLFIFELAILSQQRNSEYGVGEHILVSDFCNHFHKQLLEFANFVDGIDHKSTIGEFGASKECFEIRGIEYRNVGECRLNTITNIWLIYRIDKALDVLTCMILWRANIIACFNVFSPKVIHIRNKIGKAARAGAAVSYEADIFFKEVNKRFQVLGRLVVEVFQEEQTFFSKIFQVISKAIMNKSRSVCIVHVQCFRPLCAKPLVCCLEAIFLIQFIIDFVESKKLSVGLGHFIHQRTNVFIFNISRAVDRCVCYGFCINEVVDEVNITKLGISKTVKFGKFFTKFRLHFVILCSKIFAQWDVEISHWLPPVH